MTAPRILLVGLALAAGCASEASAHRYTLPPPAGDDRVGASTKRAAPVVVSPAPRPARRREALLPTPVNARGR